MDLSNLWRTSQSDGVTPLAHCRYPGRPLLSDPAGRRRGAREGHQVPVHQAEDAAGGRHDQGGGGLRVCRDQEGERFYYNILIAGGEGLLISCNTLQNLSR